MIIKIQLLLINSLLISSICAQSVKIKKLENSPTTFYECEEIMVGIEVQNITRDTLNYNLKGLFNIIDIKTTSGDVVTNENYHAFQDFKSHAKHTEKNKDNYFQKIAPQAKVNMLLYGFFYLYSNSKLSVINSNYKNYLFLKAGNYKIHFEVKLENIVEKYEYDIIIKQVDENLKPQFKEFAEAISYCEKNFDNPSAELIGDTINPTITRFLNKFKNGPFTKTAFNHIFELENYLARDYYLKNEFYTNSLLEMLENIYKGDEWMSYCVNFQSDLFINNLFSAKVNSYNENKEEQMNKYLTGLELFSPLFTDRIIESISKYCDRTKLVNFARLREQKEQKTKKSAR